MKDRKQSFAPGRTARTLLTCALGLMSNLATQAQDLEKVNNIFYNRLDAIFYHQQSVLPSGQRSSKQYLKIGKRLFLLESLQTVSSSGQRLQEDYLLETVANDTLSINKATYSLSANQELEGRQIAAGMLHDYPTHSSVEATEEIILLQEFNPWDMLRLQPGNAQSGQVVYVKNAAVDFKGDTLACYALTQRGGEYRIELKERIIKSSRRWQGNAEVAYYYTIDLAQRQVSVARPPNDSRSIQRWKRIYTNKTDFSEVCTVTGLGEGGDPPNMWVYILYSRRFQQKSPTRSIDKYTIPSIDKTKPASTFSIVSRSE
ncbi:MAG: hypothetical protein ACRYFX_08705 [Janthinobacterium lividum]